jgi:UDP-N-acetylmuramoyl-tripeptide--D-alanyl-D-alanine ligase
MEARSIQFIAKACEGELLKGMEGASANRVCTDSRQVQPGDVFFALHGEKFDGHYYLTEVVEKGAVAVVVQHGRSAGISGDCAIIAVDDTRLALGRFAAAYRRDFELPVVAVGGSNGKTTTKELVASVLREKLATLWSQASFNNDIGVPLTLLRLNHSHEAAVVEAGTNHPGELAPLVKMIAPKMGVIPNIGREHLEFFGDVPGVAQEEGWLAELLPVGGKLFINGDNEWTTAIVGRTKAEVVRVGFGPGNDWKVRDLQPDRDGTSFVVDSARTEFAGDYRVNLLGRHQAINAALAIAVGVEAGLTRAEIQRGLAACKPAKMRLEVWEYNEVSILDDAYNANPDSVVAALETLRDFPCRGRRVAVLGDMAELGAHSQSAHEEIGRQAAELSVGQLFAVGKMAPFIARGARQAGLNRVFEFAEVEAVGPAVKAFIKSGDVLLLKASRASRLEQISNMLKAIEALKRSTN